MKLSINKENLVIFIKKELIKFDYTKKQNIEEYLKKLIIKIKKIYKIKIAGSYIINIYQNDKYGFIIELIKKDDLEFFPDLIDLKINVFYNSEIFLQIEDYFNIEKEENIYYYDNQYFLNINEIENKELLRLTEFCSYFYGKRLIELKNHLKLIK